MIFTRMSKIDPVYTIVSSELIARILNAIDMMTVEQAGDTLKRDVENYIKWTDSSGTVPLDEVGLFLDVFYDQKENNEIVGIRVGNTETYRGIR